MSFFQTFKQRDVLIITLTAAAIIMIINGTRQTMGLFISPLNSSTGLGIVSISLAMAVGQFVWGAAQPIAGFIADRHGARPVLLGGLCLTVVGTALIPLMDSTWGLIFTIGFISAIGNGACSFSILIGTVSKRIPAEARGNAAGLINAGSSMGQFVFAPITTRLIQSLGWMNAMWSLVLLALLSLPLINKLTKNVPAPPVSQAAGGSAGAAVKEAFKNPSYLLLHLGFFTCGFHIAMLVTHLPGEVDLCGLPPGVAGWSLGIIGLANIFGSIFVGSQINRFKSKNILAVMYGSRAVLIALYLMAPKTELTFYIFAIGLGATWLATVPPTASIVGKLFGVRYLSTLFGLTLLSHQIGAFLGAYVGGLVLYSFGDYQWMWYADIALSAMAALINLPIKEPAPVMATAAA
ncbi:MAG: MFS transporter [Alcaligenaceae bacterium]